MSLLISSMLHGLCGISASEKHVWLGRNSPAAFDCSGVTKWTSLPGGAIPKLTDKEKQRTLEYLQASLC